MAYFTISNGPRGCYMDDSAFIIRCTTRRELKAALEDECYYLRDAGYVGASKRNVAHIAAIAWKNRKRFQLPYCLPLQPAHVEPGNYCYGLFVSSATRAEYLAQQSDE